MKKLIVFFEAVALAGMMFGQTSQTNLPTDAGMYVETPGGGCKKIIGQIVEFRRTGSLVVSAVTGGIKTRKENIQLLGAHAQTIVSHQPAFYFIPAKQAADAGVNAGDLILVRLEDKPNRRQFEIGAVGLARASAGITLTHQVQLLRSEVKSGIYKVMPATELNRGEYALYLARGEGLAPYVYDFIVPEVSPVATKAQTPLPPVDQPPHQPAFELSAADFSSRPQAAPSGMVHVSKDATIGVFCDGNPDVRHDGVVLTALTPGGPAEQAGIKAGDTILAINNRYLFTIRELQEEISRHEPGTEISVRYRRYTTIHDTSLVVGRVQ